MMSTDEATGFPVALRGYDRGEVDRRVALLTEQLEAGRATLNQLRSALEISEGERLALRRSIESIHRGAELDDQRIRSDAEAYLTQAKRLLTAAQAEAASLIDEARQAAKTAARDEHVRIEHARAELEALRNRIEAERLDVDDRRRQTRSEIAALAQRLVDLQPADPDDQPEVSEVPEPSLDLVEQSVIADVVLYESAPNPVASDASEQDPDADLEPTPTEAVGLEFPAPTGRDPHPVNTEWVDDVEDSSGAEAPDVPETTPQLDWTPRVEQAASLSGVTSLSADDERQLDDAFDAYFSDGIEHEPSRAWMLS